MTAGSERVIVTAMRPRALTLTLAALSAASVARAGDAPPPTPNQAEIEAWLDARGMKGETGDPSANLEVPPPLPRPHGFVVETSLGALGHLGPLSHVSPISPWFHAQLGFEPFKWAMVFVEGDIALSSTSYAAPPPEPRSYSLYGVGGGLRFTVKPTDRFGIYLQGSIGGAAVSDDVLGVYGYRDADQLSPYYGGMLGLEWYQVSRHLAFTLNGGVRNYSQLLARERSSQTPLAWIGALSLRYAF